MSVLVEHPDGTISRIPVVNDCVVLAKGDRIVPITEARCMDVTGDQPKQAEWQDWPAMYGGEAAKAKHAEKLDPYAPCMTHQQVTEVTGAADHRQAHYTEQMNARLNAASVPALVRLNQHQVLTLLSEAANELAYDLQWHEAHIDSPLHRRHVLDSLDGIRGLAMKLNDGALPR